MRKLPLILAAAALTALTLAGCSGTPSPTASPSASGAAQAQPGTCVNTPEGDASKSIKVGGDAGAKATADFKFPLMAKSTERTVLSKGDGEELKVGDMTFINFTAFNATSGKEISSTYDQGSSSEVVGVDETQGLPGFSKAIECAPAGSRIVAVVPPADGFGAQGNSSLGIAATDSLVFVFDVSKSTVNAADTASLKATGTPQPPVAGVPAVTIADDGTPTVTIPDTAPPAETTVTVLKKGDGQVVGPTDSSIVQYQGIIWGSKKIFDQSWGRSPLPVSPGGSIAGFLKAIEGQTVGSQVIVSMTPADGYGDQGNSQAGIAPTDTLVFVIDILAAG
jgi:FKBP-type peptidyl-prolyl cis-trans isomerase